MTKNDIKRALFDLIHQDTQGPPDPKITDEFLALLGATVPDTVPSDTGGDVDLSPFVRKDGSNMSGALTIDTNKIVLNADGSAGFATGSLNIASSGAISFPDGSDGAPSMSFNSDSTLGLFLSGVGIVGVTGGLRLAGTVFPDSSNAFDIGTTSIRWRDGWFSRTVLASRFQTTGETLVYNANTALDFSTAGWKSISLTGNITFTSSNVAADREIAIRIVSDGSLRTLTFPAGWVFVSSAAPTSIAANKTAILSLRAFGGTDSTVVASYVVQP